MTHEEYLEAKKLYWHYSQIVSDYERQIRYREINRKEDAIKEKFPKGTLITFTGGSYTKKLKRGSQYHIVSIRKESHYINWTITVKTEKKEYVQLPEYCFLEMRELNTQLKKEFNESTNN
jgi:hypothetical protein